MSSKTQLIPLITSSIPSYPISTVLDCACGIGKWGGVLRTHLPQVANAYIIGLDIFRKNIEYAKKYGAYDDLVIADITSLPFKDDSFTLSVAAEVIEHLYKTQGYDLIRELERISTNRIILTTPNGYWPDNPLEYVNGLVNIHENHKSAWYVNDFTKKGYKVHAIGLNIKISITNALVQQLIGGMDFLLFPGWIMPQLGKHLVAFRDKH